MRFRLAVCTFLLTLTGPRVLAQGRKSPNDLSLSFPDKTWSVDVDAPGFFAKGKGQKPDGREYLFANNPRTGVILSVMLQQLANAAHATSCPDYLQQRLQSVSKLGYVTTDAKTSQLDSMAILEYLIPKAQDMPVQQKNIVACMAKDNIYIDIHLSKAHFQPTDEDTLMDLLNHVHISDPSSSINAMAH